MLIKKINNTNDDFIENIRDLFNTNVDKKINNTNTNNDKFIENIRDLFNNKLDKKVNNNNTNDDYIENIRDLFSILDYEPVLIKSGFDNNYLEYMKLIRARTVHWFWGLKILPTGLGFKVGQNAPFYTTYL